MTSQARKTTRTRASVLFADLVGFTGLAARMGTEEAYLVVTNALRLLDQVARKHGGSVDKYLGDCLMAVFGHPVPTPDHAVAAVEAALEMRERARAYTEELRLDPPLAIHLGVNTGPLVAGDIRGPVIREFHVLGDAVNVAARLKQRAPLGAVYVGPETFEAARERFRFEPLEPLALKGKTERLATYELVAARGGAMRPAASLALAHAPLIGREAEAAALRDALLGLASGRGGIVGLLGEEGLGKSRLLGELAQSEAAGDVALLEARMPARAEAGDRQLFVELLRAWTGIDADEEDDEASSRLEAAVRALLGDEAAQVVPDLADLLARRSRGSRFRLRPRREPRVPLADVASRLLERAAQQRPLALFLDDLDRADPASLELLEQLLPLCARCPVLLLLAARPLGAETPLARLLERARREQPDHFREVRLAPLGEAATRRLVDVLDGGGQLAPDARAMVEERAAGNPLRLVMGVFLAPALHSESDRGSQDRSRETERRRATVLFADITGFTRLTETLGDERAYAVVADALALLDRVARAHGGTVDKYLGDCVLALFGVPEALEDAPRAAINAAIEMRHSLLAFNRERALEHPLDVHSGINTGLGISGDISGPLIREFTVMGEPVSVADQLKDLAPSGSIYVGQEVQRSTRDAFEFEAVEPLAVATRPEPLPVYAVRSSQVQRYRRRAGAGGEIFSELVGRETELRALGERLTALLRGEGGVVSLIGEAGLGKSRLVAEVRDSPDAEGVRWLEGRSLSVGQQLSFHPFGDLLRTWARIGDEDAEEDLPGKVEEAVRELFGDEAAEITPFLATLMGTPLPPAMRERVDAVPDDMLDRVLRASVTRFLRRLSKEQPLVLVFDDLHWADGSSIELLEALLRLAATQPILFLHLFRDGFRDTSDRILEVVRSQFADRHAELALEPLGEDASRALVNNLFRQAEIPYAVRSLIVERAQGNPFYFEEVVRSLVEEGAVDRVNGGFRATEKIHDVVIPGTVQEVIMARVDRLPARQREMLQIAAVIGRSFHLDVLLQIFPDKEETGRILDALVASGFVVPWDRLQGVEYAFKHPLIQEATYDSQLHARREELHLRVGDAIEAALTANVPGYHAMLAYHFSLGRDAERAEESLFRAGDEAARSAASNEALHFFQQASRLYFEMHGEGGDPHKKATLERNVALALYNRGRAEEAIEHFDAALRHLGVGVTQKAWRLNLRFAVDVVAVLAQLYLSDRRRRSATSEQRETIELMFRRAQSQSTADPTRFVFDSLATLRRLGTVDPRSVAGAGEMYAAAVGIFTYGGVSFGVSRRFLERARRVTATPGGEGGRALTYRVMRAVHYFLEGDWSPEHDVEDSALEEGLRGGRLFDLAAYLGLASEKCLRQGRFEEARAKIEMLGKIRELYEYEPAKLAFYGQLLILHLEERRLSETQHDGDVYKEASPQDLLHLLSYGLKAKAQLLAGEREAAEESLSRAAEALRKAGRPLPYHLGAFLASRLHADLRDLEDAAGRVEGVPRTLRKRSRRSARAALRVVPTVAFWGPEIFRSVGRQAWLCGQTKEALRWWERSLAAGRRLGTRPELARTAQELSLRLAEGRRGARELEGRGTASWRDEARSVFTELGLAWDLERLEGDSPP